MYNEKVPKDLHISINKEEEQIPELALEIT